MEVAYKIIGGDHREYGPVSLAELKNWICDGRVVGQTPVWRSDLTTWQPAARYSELQPEIGQVTPVSTATPVDALEPAGFWPRLGAYLVDGFVLYSIFFIGWSGLSKIMSWQEPDLRGLNVKTVTDLLPIFKVLLVQTAAFYVWKVIYDVSLNGRFGATIGKMVVGMKIVRLDDSPISYGVALIRSLGTILSDCLCYAGYLFIAFRDDKRALHDLVAGTRVVYRR